MKLSKKIGIIAVFLITIFSSILLPITPSYAVDACSKYTDPDVAAANGCGGSTTDISDVIVGAINGVVGILGAVAAIYIVVGAIGLMTSSGDSAKLEKAKKTILYAAIGLIIAALTFAIVNFVIAKVINGSGSGESDGEDEPAVSSITISSS